VLILTELHFHHHHHHIYFRLPERLQKPIKLATIKQQKENCKNQKIQKSKKDFLNTPVYKTCS